jgi:ADP-ribose pyrophosphatase
MEIERPKSNQPIPENAKKVFDGIIFDIYQWEQEQFDGTIKTFEKAKRPDTVVVFPVLNMVKFFLLNKSNPEEVLLWLLLVV